MGGRGNPENHGIGVLHMILSQLFSKSKQWEFLSENPLGAVCVYVPPFF